MINGNNTNDNKLLAEDNLVKSKHSIWLIPGILINNRTFYGTWKGENIFEALCASFKSKPEVCYDEGAFYKDVAEKGGLSLWIIGLIIFGVIIFNIVLFLICRKYIKRRISDKVEDTDINNRINSVVTSYLALKETK